MTASILDGIGSVFGHSGAVPGTKSLAEVQRKHPWYEPDLSFNELLLRCQSWRRSRAAQGLGHYDANGRWTDRPQEGMG